MSSKKADEFYQFDPGGAFPFFPKLLNECPVEPEGVRVPLEASPACQNRDGFVKIEAEHEWVKDSLSHIRKVCEGFGFEVILADLSIFQDKRLVARNDKPYLANYVACYREVDGDPVMGAYNRALDVMERDPIVPLRSFYDYLYIRTQVPGDVSRARPQAAAQSALRRRTRYSETVEGGHEAVDERVLRLLSEFRQALGDSASLIDGSLLMAIPFHRAPYEPSTLGEAVEEVPNRGPRVGDRPRAASPGGGLFVVLERADVPPAGEAESILERLACSLQFMLTMATLTESFSQLSAQIERNNLLASMVHGGVSAIRAIGCSDIAKALSHEVPPRRVERLRNPALRQDERTALALIRALNRGMLGENTAAALLSFCEIALTRGFIGAKYRNPDPVSLRQLIEECEAMMESINVGAGLGGTYAPVRLALEEVGLGGTGTGRWEIPVDYLHAAIVRGIFLEVSRNASMYGQRSEEGAVTLQCQISSDSRGGARCLFSNEVRDTHRGRDFVTGFLERMGRVLDEIGGLSLRPLTRTGDTFEVEVWLGALRVGEGGQGAVAPVWRVSS